MSEILVSVIIPAYNSEKSINECLETVEAQSLKYKEIIVVDDGSQDLTPAILRHYDGAVRVITQKNAGAGAARNRGIAEAKGIFVAFMDADDKYPSPNVLENLVTGALDHGAHAAGGSFLLWENGKLTSNFPDDLSGYTFSDNKLMSYADYQFDYGFHRFIYEKRVLDDHNVRFPSYPRYQDPPFMARALDACGEFYAMRMASYLYHADPGKLKWDDRKAVGLMRGLTDELVFSREKGYDKLHRLVAQRVESEFAEVFADAVSRGDPSMRRPIIDMCAAISGEMLGRGEGYLPRPISDLMASNSDLTAQLVKCRAELEAIKGSRDYRLAHKLLELPRYIKYKLGKRAQDDSF